MEKFDKSYLEMAAIWARNSYCKRRQVGALLVKDKMIILDGYNGTPSGFENICEDENDGRKRFGPVSEKILPRSVGQNIHIFRACRWVWTPSLRWSTPTTTT